MNNWKDFVLKTILDGTSYTGNKEPGIRTFSGSMLGNDPLQNYLKFMYGSHDRKEFTQATLGSVVHKGLEAIFSELKDPNIGVEEPFKASLDNGWNITGTVDLVLHDYNIIVDWKTANPTSIKNVKKEGRNSAYALQLGVYRYLYNKKYNKDIQTGLGMADKLYSYFKENNNENLELLNVPTHDPEEIEIMLYEATNTLDEYIERKEAPPQCSNLYWYGARGQKKEKMRCKYYCDNNFNCKYYKHQHQQNSMNSFIGLL